MHCNIRGVSRNLSEFKVFLAQFSFQYETFSLEEKELEMMNIDGYNIIYNNSLINKNDGVIVYVKNNFDFKYNIIPLNDIKLINLNIPDIEMRIHAAYRSPSTCPFEFNRALESYFSYQLINSKTNIFVGDINIDILKNSKLSHEYLDILYTFGFKSCINTFTREQNESNSCIDHIFIKSNRHNIEETIIPVVISSCITDHNVIAAQLFPQSSFTNHKNLAYINHINYKKLDTLMKQIDWDSIISGSESVESETNKFIKTVQNQIEEATNKIEIKKQKNN